MTYEKFDEKAIAEWLKGSYMYAVYESFMKTRNEVNFHEFFDLSNDKSICFASDYGGEHEGATHSVYTFAFHSYSSLCRWRSKLDELRESKGYVKPAEYKKIDPETRKGKLEDWLKVSVESMQGVIVSFAIDKRVESLFALNTAELINTVKHTEGFEDCPLSADVLEKAYRISHFSNLILSQILSDGYKFWWMTDRDSITQGEKRLDYMIRLHDCIFKNYCQHLEYVVKGYSIPFKKMSEAEMPYFSEDLLSLSDLFSGALSDFLDYRIGRTPEEILSGLKPKAIEILSYQQKLPTFIYLLEYDEEVRCKRIEIDVFEQK